MRLPLRPRILELDLEPAQETRNQFINLQQTDILADARARSGAKLQHAALHLLELLRRGLEPALRTEQVDVGAEHLRPPVHHPRVAADDSPAGDVLAEDLHALRWHDALEDQAGCGMQAERFLDDGVQVGQFLGFGPGHGFVSALFDGAVCGGGVEFLHQLCVDRGMLDEEVEDGGQRDGGCF